MKAHEGSEFVEHIPCSECGSSDGNALFSDSHTYCFVCGAYGHGDGANQKRAAETDRADLGLIPRGEFQTLTSRGLHHDTLRLFGYFVAEGREGKIQVAEYFTPDGQLAAQKVRGKGKKFRWVAAPAKQGDVLPFGAHLWPRGGRKLVVTEGEIDAMSMSQVQGNKWPVVSIPTGAGPQVRKYFARHLEYFEGWDEVILMFDQDEPGKEAARMAAEVLGSRAKIATLPLKDPNEMLKAGNTDQLLNAMWSAQAYRPEGVVDMASLKETVLREPERGLSLPWESLTKLTYGLRLGELWALGAGTGVGKTDLFTEIISHITTVHKEKVGVFSLEQEPGDTAKRILGKLAGHRFHVPDAGWTLDQLEACWDEHMEEGRVFLYDSFGSTEWDAIESKIRYLRDAEGVRYFFLDHLTALAASEEDERKALERIMAEMGSIVKALGITIFFVSHLATPEGKPHEEGGRVMIRHFKGSRAIGYWCSFMFGMERNQQSADETTRHTTTVRVLKDRYTGQSTGEVFHLGYDPIKGRLFETGPPVEGKAHGFDDESESGANNDF